MKTKILFSLLLFCCALQVFAQNPLVGTWQYKSGDTLQSTKIITPTHFMIFTERIKGDTKEFIRTHGGTYTISGNKYIEHINMASWEDNYDKVKTDFTFKVTGDRFRQQGTAVFGDGSKIEIDEHWEKVKLPAQNNPAIGTWNQLSSSGVDANGTKWSHTNATHKRFMIINPTHYMIIRHKDNKFESALAGAYKMEGNKFVPRFDMSSSPQPEGRKIEITQKVDGSRLMMSGILTDTDGKHTWEDVFEKVGSKTAKTASAK